MGICRVCNNYIDSEHGKYVCSSCGFDDSMNYEEYLLLGEPLETQPPVSLFIQKRDEKRLNALMQERITPVINQLYGQIQDLKEEVSMQVKKVDERNRLIALKEQTIAEQEKVIRNLHSTMNEMRLNIDQLNQQIDRLKKHTAAADRRILWRVGDIRYIGRFQQKEETAEEEPIAWRVLDVDSQNHRAFVVSEKILFPAVFNNENAGVNWRICSLHDFMEKFYQGHFTEQEKSAIREHAYETLPNPVSGTSSGGTAKSHLTILSLEDVDRYMKTSEARKAELTPFARKWKAYSQDEIHGWWWLRNAGTSSREAMYVTSYGAVSTSGHRVNDPALGVRPAMWVDYEKL